MNPTRQFERIGTQSRVNIFSDIMRLLQSHVLGDLFKNIIFLFNKLLIVSDGLEENNWDVFSVHRPGNIISS